jgi:hypothetical protein
VTQQVTGELCALLLQEGLSLQVHFTLCLLVAVDVALVVAATVPVHVPVLPLVSVSSPWHLSWSGGSGRVAWKGLQTLEAIH